MNGYGYCCPSGWHPVGNDGCARNDDKRARERPTPPSTPTCRDGLVPRDAFRGDQVCVTQVVREQVTADNNAAPTRIKPDGSCVPGYVWREAGPDDHVCVTPQTRTQTRHDNARIADNCPAGVACPPQSVPVEVVPGPCPPGSQYLRAASGPAQCVESACPAGTHDTSVGCCPNGANGVVLGENDQVCQGPNGSARPVPPACSSGWSLYNPDQSKFGGWMCGQPPACPRGYVVQHGACVSGQQPSTPPPVAPICHDGLVPRNLFAGDQVCVRPSTRTQIEKHIPRPCGGDLHCRRRPNGVTHVPVRHPTPTHPQPPRQRGGDRRWHR